MQNTNMAFWKGLSELDSRFPESIVRNYLLFLSMFPHTYLYRIFQFVINSEYFRCHEEPCRGRNCFQPLNIIHPVSLYNQPRHPVN